VVHNSDNPSVSPTDIVLHKKSRCLEIAFEDGQRFTLPCEFLRVYSPSAEVRGHGGPSGAVLQVGKERVNLQGIEPVGQYAVRLVFDDGHQSGLYSWNYLYDLGKNHDRYWQEYLAKLAAAGHVRAD
jgi:DUF971 family protein